MNRKPSPPPEPTRSFDVRGHTPPSQRRGRHSYPGRLETSSCPARPAVCSAQPDVKLQTAADLQRGNSDYIELIETAEGGVLCICLKYTEHVI